ncbi:MAG: metalloregulator ArsR/SmtB family transcription factor [Acinetobacter sp.]
MSDTIDVNTMVELSDDIVSVLKALANRDRLLILTLILEEELNVSEIEEKSKIQQPTLSQQLMILRKNEVVKTRRAGKQIYYSIRDQRFVHIIKNIFDYHTKYRSAIA